MQIITREQLKQLFPKVKKLRLPKDLDKIDFSNLHYLGWLDESDKVAYLVYNYHKQLTGLRFDFIRAGSQSMQLSFCELCKKHRKRSEIIFVTTRTKKRPKNVNYRVRGNYICSDFNQCNQDLVDLDWINKFFYQILEQD